ncbi:DUF2303 family protein [Quisquiliibacterium transsilvanicum]|uniref:Uncharacterized protein YfdQ (DUF2303 family) n=1 Tax=Quisquiliibacterium transsilvanicum TaxID=1549638 RepID=A0A7W8M8Y8_9BURK|nr:DUF2303 family protein [Quisquiliibacterium transsilvanicum]MBB5271514.1 uncharacterized protein YfdQ (DUF2303 family) [Quisquiliibacterium transsilvanicum]
MFDKEAIEALQHGGGIYEAGNAVRAAFAETSVVALPEHFTERDLEKYLPSRRRARGVMTTSALKDFAAYATAHAEAGASVFVDAGEMSATAVLNLGTPEKPGHTDNRAKLQAQQTAAYRALLQHACGRGLTQTVAAEFLEDWPDLIECFNEQGLIKPPKAIAAIRKLTIEAMRKLESSEQSLSASKSAFESVQATSADPIPTTIYFKCVPYKDLAERLFVLRLGVQTGSDKTSIVLRIVKAELHAEEMANELADLVRDSLNGTMPVLLGAYAKTN